MREPVQKTAEMLAGVFYPEELLMNYAHLLPRKFKEMEKDYENREKIPKKWEKFFEFMEERGYEQVSFSEYPEILRDWILKGVRETLKEVDSRGVAWVTNYEDSVVFIKQKDGSCSHIHVEPVPGFPSFEDYQRIFSRQLIPLQKALKNAVLQAWLHEDLFGLHEKLFKLVDGSRRVIMGENVRGFYKLHQTVYSYGEKYPVDEEKIERIRKLLEEFPEVSFDGEWKVKTETEASLLREKLQESSLEGEVSLEGPESCLEDDGLSP